MTEKTPYRRKLADPRWQRRRLAVLERDEWACRQCGCSDEELHVHHRWYQGEPWEAPDEALMTLCHECHRQRKGITKQALADLTDAICEARLTGEQLENITNAILEFGNNIYKPGGELPPDEARSETDSFIDVWLAMALYPEFRRQGFDALLWFHGKGEAEN